MEPEREHRDVVRLRCAGSERQDFARYVPDQLLAGECRTVVQRGNEPFAREVILLCRRRLGGAVRIEKQRVARCQMNDGVVVFEPGEHAEG